MKRKPISRDELRSLYNDCTVKEAADQLNLTLTGFYRLIDDAGIERKAASRNPRKERSLYKIVD